MSAKILKDGKIVDKYPIGYLPEQLLEYKHYSISLPSMSSTVGSKGTCLMPVSNLGFNSNA